jgi:hypothetical protein
MRLRVRGVWISVIMPQRIRLCLEEICFVQIRHTTASFPRVAACRSLWMGAPRDGMRCMPKTYKPPAEDSWRRQPAFLEAAIAVVNRGAVRVPAADAEAALHQLDEQASRATGGLEHTADAAARSKSGNEQTGRTPGWYHKQVPCRMTCACDKPVAPARPRC